MTGGEKLGLPKDLEAAGDLVAQLRRRQQVEQRIDGAHGEADDLQQQAQDLVDEQVVPIELFVLSGTRVRARRRGARCVVVPAGDDVMGKYGGWIALGGVVASVVAAVIKFLAEESAADRFDDCHYQIETVLDKIEATEAEQAELDRELPLTGRLGRAAVATCRAAPGRAGADAAGRKPASRSRPRDRRRPSGGSSWPKKSTRRRWPIGRPGCGRSACRTTLRPRTSRRWPANANGWPSWKRGSKIAATTCSAASASSPIVSQRIFALAEETGAPSRESHAARATRSSPRRISTSTCSASSSGRASASERKRCEPRP